jgi:tetratricopeptide (TPR) repeat protein
MSAAARIRAVVVLGAVAAVAIVAGVVYATRQDPPQPKVACRRAFKPQIVPGLSQEAPAVEAAFRRGPAAAARALEPLTQTHPRDPVVRFNYATALYCAGYTADAADAYRAAKKIGRDTYYEVAADNLLHPEFFDQGYPPFYYSGHDPLLVQGQIEQRGYHQHSAERLWAKAARLHPNDPDAQVAAAVGRFDMGDLSASFSRLGPLVKRFPRSQTVRFHLGLLLIWTGQGKQAVVELRLARRLGPGTAMGKVAAKLLAGVVTTGTNMP